MNIALKKESFTSPASDKSRQLVEFLRTHYKERRMDQATLVTAVQKLIDEHADPGKRCENLHAFSGPPNIFRPDSARESALDLAIKEKDWDLVRVLEAVVSRRQA